MSYIMKVRLAVGLTVWFEDSRIRYWALLIKKIIIYQALISLWGDFNKNVSHLNALLHGLHDDLGSQMTADLPDVNTLRECSASLQIILRDEFNQGLSGTVDHCIRHHTGLTQGSSQCQARKNVPEMWEFKKWTFGQFWAAISAWELCKKSVNLHRVRRNGLCVLMFSCSA